MSAGLCTPFLTAASGAIGKKEIHSIVPVPELALQQERSRTVGLELQGKYKSI